MQNTCLSKCLGLKLSCTKLSCFHHVILSALDVEYISSYWVTSSKNEYKRLENCQYFNFKYGYSNLFTCNIFPTLVCKKLGFFVFQFLCWIKAPLPTLWGLTYANIVSLFTFFFLVYSYTQSLVSTRCQSLFLLVLLSKGLTFFR